MKLRILLISALLALTGSALAGTVPIGATTTAPESAMGTRHQGPCEKDPSKCQADAAKFDQWCQANADKCTNLKAWAEKRIAFCQANAQKCAEHREKMKERMQALCSQDPSKPHCHAIKANEQPGDNDQSDDQQPPPPPGT